MLTRNVRYGGVCAEVKLKLFSETGLYDMIDYELYSGGVNVTYEYDQSHPVTGELLWLIEDMIDKLNAEVDTIQPLKFG